MLSALSRLKKLKKNFSLIDAIKVVRALKRERETISLSKDQSFYLRKNTKDHETFSEIFVTNIYNIPLPFEPVTIIDGGANIGLATRFFKIKYPNASIVSVEIEKENVEMIHKNLINYPDVTILNKGLYNINTHLNVKNPFQATNSYVVNVARNDEAYDIESVTIPDILEMKQWGEIDILKLDIEGAEKQLFESDYKSWLTKVQVLMVETHDRMVPKCAITVTKALDECNFCLYTTTDGGTLVFYNQTVLNKIGNEK